MQKLRETSAVSTESIAALCAALDCQPGDIMEYVPEISVELSDSANAKEYNYPDNQKTPHTEPQRAAV